MASDAEIHRQIVESSLDGLWVVDPQGRTMFANPRVADLLGRTEAEIARIGVPDVLDEEGRAQFAEHLVDLRRRGPNGHDNECVYRRPDGSPVPLVVSERALYDEDHRVIGYVHRLTDDSHRRSLMDEVSRSRSQLADAQAIARVGSWEIDTVRGEVTWSDQMYAVLDVDPASFVPGSDEFVDLLVESDRQQVIDAFTEASAVPGEHTVDARVRLSDGSTRWLRTVGQVLERAPDGRPLRLGGTVQDVNDLKEVELQLRDAVELNTVLQFMAAAANEANTLTEALVRIRGLLLAHHDWQRGVAFDVTPAGPAFRPIGEDDTVLPTGLEKAVAERVLAEGTTIFEEQQVPEHPVIGFAVAVDGEPVAVLVITARSPFERHSMLRSLVSQVAGQLAQVAAREAAATELAVARDVAMAASQAKSDFLATMSHEIRTPLNGVIGLNDLLLRTALDPRQRELAEAMQGAGRALLFLISDILDFSKIEAGGLELEAVVFEPAVVVHDTVDLFRPLAVAEGIDIDVEVDDDVPDRLDGDPGRFCQVLSNLVSNAVKFTPEGRVRVRVGATTVGRVVTVKVEVRDSGIGMDREQLGRIFQPFRQADASTTRNFGGTGLGLAIAHRLAAALGGDIGVESTLGAGSTFWFTAEFGISAGRSRRVMRDAAAEERHGGHVLVVEDNDVNRMVAVGMLEVLGYTSEVAIDGAAAAVRATSGRFDAVLMDLQMPRVDGYAATRLIREAEPPGVRVPIIALTASATSGEQERCLAAGMDGFLSKPVGVDALRRVLREHLVHPAEREHAVPPQPAADAGSARPGAPDGPAVRLRDAVLDVDRLEELAEMGTAAWPLIQTAIDNFIAGAGGNLDALRNAVAARDPSALSSAAHRLKGSAGNLGAVRVAELALALEELAESGHTVGADAVLEELASALDAASGALLRYRPAHAAAPQAYSA